MKRLPTAGMGRRPTGASLQASFQSVCCEESQSGGIALVITRISYLLDTELVLPPLWGGQRLARGEAHAEWDRFLRTPGSNIRAKTHPEGVAGHPGPITRSPQALSSSPYRGEFAKSMSCSRCSQKALTPG